MLDEGEYYYSATDVFSSCLSSISNNSSNKKKMINRRRFTDKQVRSLESIFENETKLEPKKKVQVAKELGLQPRQVAIWFQNKRARYKSKQLERDFSLLRANYNALASQFESLKKEKHSLFLQLKKLKDEMAGNKQEEREDCKENKLENEECSKNNSEEREVKPTMSMEGSDYGASILSSDEGSSENTNNNTTNNDNNNLGMERETEEIDDMLTSMMEPTNNTVGSSLTTSDHEANCWEDYPPEPAGLFDQQAVDSCSHWWDFWS